MEYEFEVHKDSDLTKELKSVLGEHVNFVLMECLDSDWEEHMDFALV